MNKEYGTFNEAERKNLSEKNGEKKEEKSTREILLDRLLKYIQEESEKDKSSIFLELDSNIINKLAKEFITVLGNEDNSLNLFIKFIEDSEEYKKYIENKNAENEKIKNLSNEVKNGCVSKENKGNIEKNELNNDENELNNDEKELLNEIERGKRINTAILPKSFLEKYNLSISGKKGNRKIKGLLQLEIKYRDFKLAAITIFYGFFLKDFDIKKSSIFEIRDLLLRKGKDFEIKDINELYEDIDRNTEGFGDAVNNKELDQRNKFISGKLYGNLKILFKDINTPISFKKILSLGLIKSGEKEILRDEYKKMYNLQEYSSTSNNGISAYIELFKEETEKLEMISSIERKTGRDLFKEFKN